MLEPIIISLSIGYVERRISWTQPSEGTGCGRCEWIHRSKYTAGRLEPSASLFVHWFSTGQRPGDVRHHSIFLIGATGSESTMTLPGAFDWSSAVKDVRIPVSIAVSKNLADGGLLLLSNWSKSWKKKTRDNGTVNRLQQPDVSRCT